MAKAQYKICLDPGHGGRDPGAIGNGLKEKDITLAISLKVAELLKQNGQEVILTRVTDRFIGQTPERTPNANISVSIHVNAGGGQGLETWVSLFNKAGESQKLGKSIQENILKQILFKNRGLKTRKNSAGNQDYLYMIRKPVGVPVLIEVGFIDNPTDANILKDKANLDKIAKGIASGILQYLGKELMEVEATKILYAGRKLDGFIVDGRTYVEVRKLCEAIGLKVHYDAKTKLVEVKR
ncbi:MAG: hypothetical protein GX918_05400 [Clostridiales bacterium]|nr:hypothetical protein [Clostridiales bacterium]